LTLPNAAILLSLRAESKVDGCYTQHGEDLSVNRREFLKRNATAGVALGLYGLSLSRLPTGKLRSKNPKIKIGVSGEHGGDQSSSAFFNSVRVNDGSWSPERLPVGKLAAQAETAQFSGSQLLSIQNPISLISYLTWHTTHGRGFVLGEY